MGTSDAEWPKMGRPSKKINWAKFEQMCARQCTKAEICLKFNIHPTCLEDKLKAKYGQTFSAVFKTFRMRGIESLRNLQFEMAMNQNEKMLLHLDKKYAHVDENIDPRCYGGEEAANTGDHKIDINVSFIDKPDKCVAEAKEIDKIKDED